MNDRYLNVQYGTLTAEVNITRISRLGGVQDAIKREFEISIPVAAGFIQLYTANRDKLITDLDDITPEKTPQYYQKLTQGGCCVVIGTSPPPTRESSKNGLFEAGVDYLMTAGDKKRKRRRTEWEVSTLGKLSYDPNSTIFQLDSNYLAKTGLPDQKLILYCRPTFHEQFKFLRERVIDDGVLGWILGPPGTGKSTTALAFASTLDRK
jgi:hypothetical protein